MKIDLSLNASEFKKWQKQVLKEVQSESKEIIKDATLATEANAKRLCPVDQGPLREGIFSTVKNYKGEVSTSPSTPYALFVHEGHWIREGQLFPTKDGGFKRVKETRFIDGQPFMAEAFDLISEDVEAEFKKLLNKIK